MKTLSITLLLLLSSFCLKGQTSLYTELLGGGWGTVSINVDQRLNFIHDQLG